MNNDTHIIDPLINSVKIREILWDQQNPQHHNRYVLDKLWREVAEENRCSVKEAQTKWKSKRDNYRKELRKMQDNQSAPKSCWSYFSMLNFLRPQFEEKSEKPAKRRRYEEQTGEEVDIDEHNAENTEEFLTVIGNFCENEDYNGSDNFPQCDVDETVNARKAGSSKLFSKTIARIFNESRDDDLLFFKSLLPHIKKIGEAQKLHFRNDVQNLVIKYAYS